MEIKRRSVMAALAVGAGAATLAACGEDKKSSGADGAKEGGKLTYWSMWQEKEPQAEVLKQAIEDFKKETKTEVKVEWQGRDVLTKVAPLLRAGNDLPDLVDQAFDKVAPGLGRPGKAEDLSEVMKGKGADGKTLDEAGLKNFSTVDSLDGKTILAPYAANANVLWFNATATPSLASNPPETLAALNDFLLKKKTEENKPQIGIDGAYPYARLIWFMNVLRINMGSSQAVLELAGDKTGAAWEKPEVKAAADYVESLVNEKLFADDAFGTKHPAQQEAFATGKGTVLAMGSWLPSELEKSLPKDAKLEGMPFPGKAADQAQDVETSLFGFAIPTGAKNKDQAKAFITFFLQEKYQKELVAKAKSLPVLASVDGPAGQEKLVEALRAGHVSPVHANIDAVYPGYMQFVKDATLKLMSGQAKADAFIAECKKGAADYWAKNG